MKSMKITKVLTTVLCALTLLLVPGLLLAQGAATGDIHVIVKDPAGASVANATVTARDAARGLDRTSKSSAQGEYSLILLPPGTYAVTVEAPGFNTTIATGVVVTVGGSVDVPVALKLATGKETVTVTAEAEVIQTAQTSTTETINQKSIDNLPINGRNYIDFTKTNSQVVRDNAPSIGAAPTSGLNFGGQRARSNLVNVDGADAVDNSTNGIRSTVSQEAVQEFQIITNGYSPEYGRAAGGVVNIITRSGSNDFHGSVFGYLRNRKIQAVNPFSNVPNPAYTRVQAGVALGGAIKKDKTFYYFAYENTRRHETGFSSIGANNYGLVPYDAGTIFGAGPGLFNLQLTPDQAGFLTAITPSYPFLPAQLQGAIQKYAFLAGGSSEIAINGNYPGAFAFIPGVTGLNQFPTSGATLPANFLPLAGQSGNFPVFEGTSVYSLRLDHNVSNNNRLMFRANVSPSLVNGIQPQGQNQTFGQNSQSRTSLQQYRDLAGTVQDTWTIGNNRINEFRFQYARRGLLYNFAQSPGGSSPAANIGGYAFVGREPFSFIRRTEKRYQFTDNFSWTKGTHNTKFGVDVNYLPLSAIFTVNYGGVFNFGGLDASSLGFPDFKSFGLPGLPGFTGLQSYGLGIPSTFVQGIGNPQDSFSNKTLGGFWQDSWRATHKLTVNYGVRYDVEFGPQFKPPVAAAQAAYNALQVQKGIQNDFNNVAPRIGVAWDPHGDGKTKISGSYGLFYDHPLLGLYFLGDASDGSSSGQLLFAGSSPCAIGAPPPATAGDFAATLNATNIFQGTLGNANCLGPLAQAGFGYQANQQRFDPSYSQSLFLNQGYIAAGFPLAFQPFGFPQGKNFVFAYSNQANLSFEHDLGRGYSLSVAYNFNGGRHLNRPINVNAVRGDLLVANWRAAKADFAKTGVTNATSPLSVSACGVGPGGAYVPATLVNFFRRSGFNPSVANAFAASGPGGLACLGLAQIVLKAEGLGLGANGGPCDPTQPGSCTSVPFGDFNPNESNGSSVYHALSINLRKNFADHYSFLASYTWSKSLDDSTDLQSTLSPQDSYNLKAERSISSFNEPHRFVFSGVYQTGRVSGDGLSAKLRSGWTFAPILDIGAGRPFNIGTDQDTTFQFAPGEARPNAVAAGTPATSCSTDLPVASKYSPTGFFQVPCFIDGQLAGNLSRNAGRQPYTLFSDLRISKRIPLGERINLDGIVDMFNLPNKFNVLSVNPLYNVAGQVTAASDPRQFQLALRLSW